MTSQLPGQATKGFIPGFRAGKRAMYQAAEVNPSYGVNTIQDKEFQKILQAQGINFKETPKAFLGAYASRVLGDIVADETRGVYWRYNHPIAIAEKVTQKIIDPNKTLPRYTSAAIGASILAPAFALSGAYDPTNISELGRPKGFKQNRPDSEDPTQSIEPGTEIFERFIQGRQGRPLAYEKAQKEIPTLTKKRYANYMDFFYNQSGILGVAKVTPENLQGVPEARLFGYPVSIPTVTTAVGGVLGARTALASAPRPPQAQQMALLSNIPENIPTKIHPKGQGVRGTVGGLLGGAAGAIAGVLANQAIAASQNDTQLPMY